MNKSAKIIVVNEVIMNYVICGPAGAGKSTYVRKHMQPGDLIVDLDAIYTAISYLGNHRKPEQLRDVSLLVFKYLVDSIDPDPSKNSFPNSWVIVNGARLMERKHLKNKLSAQVVMLDIDQHECLSRIEKDGERNGYGIPWGNIVKKWWDSYEPDDGD